MLASMHDAAAPMLRPRRSARAAGSSLRPLVELLAAAPSVNHQPPRLASQCCWSCFDYVRQPQSPQRPTAFCASLQPGYTPFADTPPPALAAHLKGVPLTRFGLTLGCRTARSQVCHRGCATRDVPSQPSAPHEPLLSGAESPRTRGIAELHAIYLDFEGCGGACPQVSALESHAQPPGSHTCSHCKKWVELGLRPWTQFQEGPTERALSKQELAFSVQRRHQAASHCSSPCPFTPAAKTSRCSVLQVCIFSHFPLKGSRFFCEFGYFWPAGLLRDASDVVSLDCLYHVSVHAHLSTRTMPSGFLQPPSMKNHTKRQDSQAGPSVPGHTGIGLL